MIKNTLLLLGASTTLVVAPAAAKTSDECAAAARYSSDRDGVSFLVMRDGKVVCEDYPNGGAADKPHLLASGTKSFTGIIAAAAVQDGFLSLDEPVSTTIAEWKNDSRKARITIRQLLGLISGLPGGPNGQPPTYIAAIAMPVTAEPGTLFQYGPAPFQVFGELMKRKLAARGVDADALNYLNRRVLDPIGVKPASWRRYSDGNPTMPSGAAFNARNWALVGQFMLQGGKWNGQQLVDARSLAILTASGPVNPSYGISWWVEGARGSIPPTDPVSTTVDLTANALILPAGVYAAVGAGIQRLYVVPSQKLVIVRQTDQTGAVARAARRAARRAGRRMNPDGETPAPRWSDSSFLTLAIKIH